MNRIERKLYQIVNLLSEAEGEIVKNKKTGNVYMVKTFDPGKHDKPTPDEIEKTKAAHGGKIPTTDKPEPKPAAPAPKPDEAPKAEPQKLGASDFQSGAETREKSPTKSDKKSKRPGADDSKLKNLMPGIDTKKKTLDEVPPEAKMELSTKIDDLVGMVNKAKEKGEKPEYFNLCKVTVPGTNLYCDGNLGIDRNDMPQFKGNARPGSPADKLPKNKDNEVDGEAFFKQLLDKDGIKVNSGPNDEGVEVPPDRLKATQMNMVGDKVAGMYSALEKDPKNPALTAPIYVSNDGYVLDGHHRWAAIVAYNAKNPDKPIPMKTRIIDEPIKPLVDRANKYADYIGIEKKAAVAGQGNPALKKQTAEKKNLSLGNLLKGKN